MWLEKGGARGVWGGGRGPGLRRLVCMLSLSSILQEAGERGSEAQLRKFCSMDGRLQGPGLVAGNQVRSLAGEDE